MLKRFEISDLDLSPVQRFMNKSSSVKIRTIFVGKKCCAWLRSVFKPKAAINQSFKKKIVSSLVQLLHNPAKPHYF